MKSPVFILGLALLVGVAHGPVLAAAQALPTQVSNMQEPASQAQTRQELVLQEHGPLALDPPPPNVQVKPFPKVLPYDGGAAPEGYRLQSRPAMWFWLPGVAVFFATYAVSFVVGIAASYPDGIKVAYLIPFAGPFVAIAEHRLKPQLNAFACIFGAGQIVGLGLLVAGLVVHQKRFVRIAEADLSLAPTILAPNVPGLGLLGRF